MKPTHHPLVILLVCTFLTVCTWAATPKEAAEKTKITISVEQIPAASVIAKISKLAAVTAHYTIPAQEKDAVLTLQLTDASATRWGTISIGSKAGPQREPDLTNSPHILLPTSSSPPSSTGSVMATEGF